MSKKNKIEASNIKEFTNKALYLIGDEILPSKENPLLRNHNIGKTVKAEDRTRLNFLRDIILKDTFPTVPSLLFLENDIAGGVIIKEYYSVKYYMSILDTYKNNILTILQQNKDEIDKINSKSKYGLDKLKYNIDKDLLIIKFKENLDKTFPTQNDFNEFINIFAKNNYNIFKDNDDIKALFFKIFQKEFKGNSNTKKFFESLFARYNEIRRTMLKYIKANIVMSGGSQSSLQRIDSNSINNSMSNISSLTNNERSSTNNFKASNKKNLINIPNIPIKPITIDGLFEHESLHGLLAFDYIFNLHNSFNVMQKIEEEKEKLEKKNNSKINYNSYVINSPNLQNSKKKNNNTEYGSKPLYNKINNYNLLYFDVIDKNEIKTNHLKNINNIYNEFYNNLLRCLNTSDSDLYENLINLLLLDFNLIKLLFYYVKPINFNTAIDVSYKIKKYIYNNITDFQDYYNDYLEWFKIFKGKGQKDTSDNFMLEDFNFISFLENIIGFRKEINNSKPKPIESIIENL